MLAESGVDDTHVEEDLGGVCDLVELADSVLELIVVVAGEGSDPGLDFLPDLSALVVFEGWQLCACSPASETWLRCDALCSAAGWVSWKKLLLQSVSVSLVPFKIREKSGKRTIGRKDLSKAGKKREERSK